MSHTLKINGIEFTFPYKPYPSQILSVSKIIDAIKNNKTAVIESPTGSGKSLSILVGVMGYLVNERKCNRDKKIVSINEKNKEIVLQNKKVIICSRTHSQITQLISQLKKTIYTPKIATLASRKITCINPKINESYDLNMACKDSIKKNQCKWFLKKDQFVKSINKNRTDDYVSSNQTKGHIEKIKENQNNVLKFVQSQNIFDIESFISYSKKCSACPYYSLRALSNTSDIIFIPYNYLIDPSIRRSMDLDTANSIIIIDEAHNLDDVCRTSGSIRITNYNLLTIFKEIISLFRKLPEFKNTLMVLNFLFKKIEKLPENIDNFFLEHKDEKSSSSSDFFMKHNLNRISSFDSEQYILKSDEIINYLNSCSINLELILKIKSMTEIFNKKNDENDLNSNISENMLRMIEGLLNILFLIFQGKKDSYGLILNVDKREKENKKVKLNHKDEYENDFSYSSTSKKYEIQFVLLDAGLIFNTLNFSSLILLSGTLAPFNLLEKELNNEFQFKLIAPSVMKKNIFIRKIEKFKDEEVNGNYENRQNKKFIDLLIKIIFELWSKLKKGGTVVFLPSYKCLNEVYNRMREIHGHQMKSMNSHKRKSFENILQKNEPLYDLKHEKIELCDIYTENGNDHDLIMKEYGKKSKIKKPILLAVYRGKMSEGIDFKDELARLLICISLPYPNIRDPIVKLNKDKKRDWYMNQTYRALNQAIGRIVRHRNDWGGVFLVDNRVNKEFISKWIREEMYSGDLVHMIDEWKEFLEIKRIE